MNEIVKPKSVLTLFHKSMLIISLTLMLISFTQVAIYLPDFGPGVGESAFYGWYLFFLVGQDSLLILFGKLWLFG